jgi:tetratricopeptide (TPR) repeat protein
MLAHLAALDVKDLATLLLSGAALLTSISVALFNLRVQRSKRSDDARKAFEDAILAIMTAKQSYEALRREAGKEFESPEFAPRRVAIVDTRNFNLSKALHAVSVANLVTSSADNLLLASALMESGRHSASVPFYQRAVHLAWDQYERATALRVLGRAQILTGEHDDGRAMMTEAANLFTALANDKGYETDRMFDEVAETYKRLINCEITIGLKEHLEADVAALEGASAGMTSSRAVAMRDFATNIRAGYLRSSEGSARMSSGSER